MSARAFPLVVLLWATGCASTGPGRESGPSGSDRGASAKSHSNPAAAPGADGSINRLLVNDDTVAATALAAELRKELATKAQSLGPDETRTFVERRAAELITDRVAEMLLYQRAKSKLPAESNKKLDALVDAEVRRIVATQHDGVLHLYEQELTAQGKTLDEVRERIRREIVIAGFMEEEIKPKVGEPTRSELMTAFDAMAASLRHPERRQMSLIEVRLTDADSAADATFGSPGDARSAALARIQEAREELRRGAAFSEVARRVSVGARASEGGAWGWITPGSVRERYDPAVGVLYGLAKGEVSEIVESGDTFFLVRCDEIEPALDPDFTALQPLLRERWIREKSNRLVVELVNSLRREATFEPPNLEAFHAAVIREVLSSAPPTNPPVGPVP